MLNTLRACRNQAELCCGNCIYWRLEPRGTWGYCKAHDSWAFPDDHCSRGQRRPVEVEPNKEKAMLSESQKNNVIRMSGDELVVSRKIYAFLKEKVRMQPEVSEGPELRHFGLFGSIFFRGYRVVARDGTVECACRELAEFIMKETEGKGVS